MTKKIYQKFALTLILLLTVAAMLGTVIQAAAADVYVLKIDYEANQCSVSVKVDGKPAVYDDVAKEYYIPKSHGSVSIQITPKVGYQLSALTDKETGKELVPSGVAGDTYEPTLIKDMHYYVTGTAKIYKIEERSAEGLGHDSVFGVKTYQYGRS